MVGGIPGTTPSGDALWILQAISKPHIKELVILSEAKNLIFLNS
jgi:hypothetical protein